MLLQAIYPTPEHQAAAEAIVEFWATHYNIDAVLLANSCARGKATRDSGLDMVALARPELLCSQLSTLEADWARFEKTNPAISAMKKVGNGLRFSRRALHPNTTNGNECLNCGTLARSAGSACWAASSRWLPQCTG